MARALMREEVENAAGVLQPNTLIVFAEDSAGVTPLVQPIYNAQTGGSAIAVGSRTTDAYGIFTGWTDRPQNAWAKPAGATVYMPVAFEADQGTVVNPWIDVAAYGAKGTEADCTTALQNAVAALPASGGTLMFSNPEGVYIHNASLGLGANVTVCGASPYTTLKAKDGAALTWQFLTSFSNNHFHDLVFDGNRDNGGYIDTEGAYGAAILTQGSGTTVVDCEFKNFTYQGILCQVIGNITVDRCYFHDGGSRTSVNGWGAGFKVNAGVANCKVLNSRFETIYGTNGAAGLRRGGCVAADGTDFFFIGNYVKDCYNAGGMFADNASAGTERRWVLNNNRMVISADLPAYPTVCFELSGYGYTIVGNYLTSSRANGAQGYGWGITVNPVGVGHAGDAVITGNTILNFDKGIWLYDTGAVSASRTKNIVISGNAIRTCTSGVVGDPGSTPPLEDIANISVTGNDFTGTVTPITDNSLTKEIKHSGNTPANAAGPDAYATFTPTGDQAGALTLTVGYAEYLIQGNRAHVQIKVTVTANAGSGNNVVSLGALPAVVAPIRVGARCIAGHGVIFDTSTGTTYPVQAEAATATTLKFISSASTGYWGVSPNIALANGDEIELDLLYRIA